MSKQRTEQPAVSWQQAPDGSWHPIVPSTGTTTVNVQKSNGCANAVGAVLLLLVLAAVALVFIATASKQTPKSTTTTSVTSTSVVQ